MSNLAAQIREALSMFVRSGTEPALIGGLAVVAHQVVRATKDVDFLVEAEAADKVHAALLDLGYECLYRSEDAANYVRAAEGLDLLYAHRPLARRLLAQASERETPMGRMRIVSVEGLIGFKLQGFVNDGVQLVGLALPRPDADDTRFRSTAVLHRPEILQVAGEPKCPILAADADAHRIT